MKRIILATLLVISPVLAQQQSGHPFRKDLATAVRNGNLSESEQQKYTYALSVLQAQKAKRKGGETADRQAMRAAMQDLRTIAASPNLRQEDRDRLAAEQPAGKHRKGKKPTV